MLYLHWQECKPSQGIPGPLTRFLKECRATAEQRTEEEDIRTVPSTIPPYKPGQDLSGAKFGDLSGEDIRKMCNVVYDEIVKWRKNLFLLPSGATGKQFIVEMCKYLNMFQVSSSSMEVSALQIVMIMPALLLQKPSKHSKAKDHTEALKRRLQLWEQGKLDELLREGKAIYSHVSKSQHTSLVIQRKYLFS